MRQISEQLQDAPLTKLISHFIELPKSQFFLKEWKISFKTVLVSIFPTAF